MAPRELRRFVGDSWLETVTRYLDSIDAGETTEFESLLVDEDITEPVVPGTVVDVRSFESRMSAAAYFYPLIAEVRAQSEDLPRLKGLWTWIAIVWMDLLAPVEDGRRRLKARPRWVLESENWTRYYRHMFVGPYAILHVYAHDPKQALAVLATPVDKPGELVEQLASRQEIIRAPGVLGAATRLYVDPATNLIKRGAAGKDSPGVVRRFADVLQQLDLTYDRRSLSVDQVIELLPAEFSRFR